MRKTFMAAPKNTPMTGEIWHLTIDDLLAPLPETTRLGGPGPFVINLSASTAPITVPAKSIAGCEQAHMYQLQRTEDRRPRYRLRLGPFSSEDEADAVLMRVRDIFPGALTATADDDDLRAIATLRAKTGALPPAPEKPAASSRPAAKPTVSAAATAATVPTLSDTPPSPAKPISPAILTAAPTAPAKPMASAVPTLTAAPAGPAKSMAPTIPTLTAAPAASTKPMAPAVPTPSVSPAVPATPAAPAIPTVSTAPTPAKPMAPAVPAVSATPTAEQKVPVRVPAVVPKLNAPVPRQAEESSKRVPSLDATQTVFALTELELEDASASLWFVIQLSLAEEAFDPDTLPNLDIFSVYRLYSVAGIDQGRIMHALRLGFFTEEISAGAVASYLATFYDKPTIKRVSSAERERFAEQCFEPRKDVGATGKHAAIEITSERFVRERRTGAAK
jgi:hypothetical protein